MYSHFKQQIDTALAGNQSEVRDVLTRGSYGVEVAITDAGKPRSAVFSLFGSQDTGFLERHVQFVSHYARVRLNLNNMKLLIGLVIGAKGGNGLAKGWAFEDAVFELFRAGWEGKLEVMLLPGQNIDDAVRGFKITSTTNMGAPHRNIYESVRQKTLLSPGSTLPTEAVLIGSNFPVVDILDARNRGFNVTTSSATRPALNLKLVNKVRKELGLEEGTLLHLVSVLRPGVSKNVGPNVSEKLQPLFKDLVMLYKVEVPEARDKVWERVAETISCSSSTKESDDKVPGLAGTDRE
jgi:hypothetical protein